MRRACLQKRRYHGSMDWHDLSNAQWERLAPLLPPERPRRGRPNHNHRRVVNGMLWRLATGAPWRDLPSDDHAKDTDFDDLEIPF